MKVQMLLAFSLLCSVIVCAQAAEAPKLKEHHAKLECSVCHINGKMNTPASDDACLKCHGTKKDLVEKTKSLPMNPHTSPHWGTDAPCSFCHKEHRPSQAVCAYCHGQLKKEIP